MVMDHYRAKEGWITLFLIGRGRPKGYEGLFIFFAFPCLRAQNACDKVTSCCFHSQRDSAFNRTFRLALPRLKVYNHVIQP